MSRKGTATDGLKELGEIDVFCTEVEKSRLRLTELTKSRTAEVRMRAYEALLTQGECDVASLLRAAIIDRDELVRVAGIEAAALRRDSSVAMELRGLLCDKSCLVRSAAAVALAELGAVEAIPALEKSLESSDEETSYSLRFALAKLGQREQLLPFLGGLFHSFYRIRCATAHLMIELATNENREFLIGLLRLVSGVESTVAAKSSIDFAIAELAGVQGSTSRPRLPVTSASDDGIGSNVSRKLRQR